MNQGVGNFDPSPGIGLQSDGKVVASVEIPPNGDASSFHLTARSVWVSQRYFPDCRHMALRYRAPRWWRYAGRWHRWTCLECGLEIRVARKG